jgi:hypothetical protein
MNFLRLLLLPVLIGRVVQILVDSLVHQVRIDTASYRKDIPIEIAQPAPILSLTSVVIILSNV